MTTPPAVEEVSDADVKRAMATISQVRDPPPLATRRQPATRHHSHRRPACDAIPFTLAISPRCSCVDARLCNPVLGHARLGGCIQRCSTRVVHSRTAAGADGRLCVSLLGCARLGGLVPPCCYAQLPAERAAAAVLPCRRLWVRCGRRGTRSIAGSSSRSSSEAGSTTGSRSTCRAEQRRSC